MKVKSVKAVASLIVETDDAEYSTYCRNGGGSWEVRKGESWEPLYNDEEIEAEYQKFIQDHPERAVYFAQPIVSTDKQEVKDHECSDGA